MDRLWTVLFVGETRGRTVGIAAKTGPRTLDERHDGGEVGARARVADE